MSKNEEYNWLDDPFDEKKAAADRERARMGGGSKAVVAIGCLVAIVLVIALIALAAWTLFGI